MQIQKMTMRECQMLLQDQGQDLAHILAQDHVQDPALLRQDLNRQHLEPQDQDRGRLLDLDHHLGRGRIPCRDLVHVQARVPGQDPIRDPKEVEVAQTQTDVNGLAGEFSFIRLHCVLLMCKTRSKDSNKEYS